MYVISANPLLINISATGVKKKVNTFLNTLLNNILKGILKKVLQRKGYQLKKIETDFVCINTILFLIQKYLSVQCF